MILRALRFAFALLRADRWPCLFDEHPDRYWPEPVENGPRCRHCDKPLSKEARHGE